MKELGATSAFPKEVGTANTHCPMGAQKDIRVGAGRGETGRGYLGRWGQLRHKDKVPREVKAKGNSRACGHPGTCLFPETWFIKLPHHSSSH